MPLFFCVLIENGKSGSRASMQKCQIQDFEFIETHVKSLLQRSVYNRNNLKRKKNMKLGFSQFQYFPIQLLRNIIYTLQYSHLKVAIVQMKPNKPALWVNNTNLTSLTWPTNPIGNIPIGPSQQLACKQLIHNNKSDIDIVVDTRVLAGKG